MVRAKPVPRTHGETYTPAARAFHWGTVALLMLQIPVGVIMAYRGNLLNIWDATTNTLYSTHKLVGMGLLVLVAYRLIYRLRKGAPADEPSLESWQKVVSHLTHWALYGLLLLVPLLGWLGVSYYPALDVFGWKLPALVKPNEAMASKVFLAHMIGAIALVLLAGMHVGAALFHYLIRKDGVLARMFPLAGRRN